MRYDSRVTMHYRALISIPISAETDDDAVSQGAEYAHSLLDPDGGVVIGHLEFVGEVDKGQLAVRRVVDEEPEFRHQFPA